MQTPLFEIGTMPSIGMTAIAGSDAIRVLEQQRSPKRKAPRPAAF